MTEFIPNLQVQLWPHQSDPEEMDAFFGNPRGKGGKASSEWQKEYLVYVVPPWKMIYVEKGRVSPIPKFWFNKVAAPSLERVLSGHITKRIRRASRRTAWTGTAERSIFVIFGARDVFQITHTGAPSI
jgi:hypothetical protein